MSKIIVTRKIQTVNGTIASSANISVQHSHTRFNLLRRRILIGPMAHAATARNENHRRRTNLRHEQGVVVGATDQLAVRNTIGPANSCASSTRLPSQIAGVHVHPLLFQPTPRCAQISTAPDSILLERRVARSTRVSRKSISSLRHMAPVHRAGLDLEHSVVPTVSGLPLDFAARSTASRFPRRQQCIMPIRHQHRARVPAYAVSFIRNELGAAIFSTFQSRDFPVENRPLLICTPQSPRNNPASATEIIRHCKPAARRNSSSVFSRGSRSRPQFGGDSTPERAAAQTAEYQIALALPP
jgi:hypothetical protein